MKSYFLATAAATLVFLIAMPVAVADDAKKMCEVPKGPPTLVLHVDRIEHDRKRNTLELKGIEGIDVIDGKGDRLATATHGDWLNALKKVPENRPEPVATGPSLMLDTRVGGESVSRQVEIVSHDPATKTTTLRLVGDKTAVDLSQMKGTVILGQFPMHIACCNCDWTCSLAWVSTGFCDTCASGVLGASTCCSQCNMPASPGGSC